MGVVKGLTSLVDRIFQPGLKLLHEEAVSMGLVLKANLCVVGDVGRQNSAHLIKCVLRILVGSKSHGAANSGAGSDNVARLLVVRKTASSSDAEVCAPATVKVHLNKIVTVHVLNTIKEREFFVQHSVLRFNNIIRLIILVAGDRGLESINDASSLLVIKAIEKRANNAKSLGDNSTNLATVVTAFSSLNFEVSTAVASERASNPKTLVVEASGVHAE